MNLELSEADVANLIMLIDAADIKGRDAEVICELKRKIRSVPDEVVAEEPAVNGHQEGVNVQSPA